MPKFPLLLAFLLALPTLHAKQPARKDNPEGAKDASTSPSPWGPWMEPEFPFFSSVLDARKLGDPFPKDNLTPRGLILNLGHNVWACYDVDLLRIACVWQGEPGKPPVTPNALAPGSYHVAGQKTKDGQDDLPEIVGQPALANGIYPGWQLGDKPELADPREPAPSPQEVGRGAVPKGRFKAVRLTGKAVEIDCEIDGVALTQTFGTDVQKGKIAFSSDVKCEPHTRPITTVLGFAASGATGLLTIGDAKPNAELMKKNCVTETLPAHSKADSVSAFWVTHLLESPGTQPNYAATHWPQTVKTTGKLGDAKDAAYVIDTIPLPLDNPWKRNVRLADLAFLDDLGHAAGVTMDGDVWMISGLKDDLKEITWKRFASGLHEPMSIVQRKGEIFVFDRNGIWRLRDSAGRGEADTYELFCNLFAQTAETREFPNSMKLAPDGSFVISKGGQEGTTLGKHNGTVIRVAPDGKSYEVVGWGLRQPFVGVHPKTGLITASDQEGNYVPTTPIHIIKDHQYYGFLSELQPHEQYPQTIADPLVWIPHSVNASGATQVWLTDAKMGSINEECLHIGYNRPEVFRILFSSRSGKPQATAVSFTRDLDFAPLNGSVNPADGQVYITGFRIWGTTATTVSGLARIRYTGRPRVLLKEATPMDKGVLLRFNLPLDRKLAENPDSYSLERWNYIRTYKYGSPQLKLDGKFGTEFMTPSSTYLSKDGLSVFIGVPDMKSGVMQMRVGWGLKGTDGLPAHNSAYFTPYDLAKFEPGKEGFKDLPVDLTPRKVSLAAQSAPTVEDGQRLYQMMGCMACHSTDGTSEGKIGPSWRGLYGKERLLKDGKTTVTADDGYLKESILDPSAKIVKGYEKLDTGMPIYAGVLNDNQIESLILFIKSLK